MAKASLKTDGQKEVAKMLGIDPDASVFGGRAPIAPFEDVERIVKASTDVIEYGNFNRFRKELIFWSAGLSGIGGAGQANRIIDGLTAIEKGYVEDVRGRKLYDIKGWDAVWAPIVGPWGTKAARDDSPTLSAPKITLGKSPFDFDMGNIFDTKESSPFDFDLKEVFK